jgi:hypothetical protein
MPTPAPHWEFLGWLLILVGLSFMGGTAWTWLRWYTNLPIPGRAEAARRWAWRR